MIEFSCPSCEKTLRTKPEKAGAKAKCPGCGEVLTVPAPAAPEPPARKSRKPAEDEFGAPADDEFGGFGDDETTSPTQDEFWGAGDEFGGQTRMPRRQKQSSRGSGSPRSGKKQECPMCGEMTSTQSRSCEHCGESLKSSSSRGSRRRGYDFDYAGFWLRFVASFVDGILVGIVNFVISFAVGLLFGVAAGGNPQNEDAFVFVQLLLNLVSIVIGWLYFALMESSESQATFGKQMLGIIVTDMNGDRLSFGRASGRHFGKIASSIFCIGYIMAGFTEKKQALHDIIASTLVVRKD